MLKNTFFLYLLFICIETQAQVIKRGNSPIPNNNNTNQQPNNQPDYNYDNYYDYPPPRYKPKPPFEFKKRNLVQVNLFDFVFTNLTLTYEFFSKDGKNGFQLPISFNMGGEPDSSQYYVHNQGRFLSAKNRIFQTGLNYNYYFLGQNYVSPYLGVGFNAGAFNYYEYTYNYSGGGYYYNNGQKKIGTNVQGGLFIGVLFNPKETITFNIKGGLGMRRYTTDFYEYTYPYGIFEASLGFKF